MADANHNRDIPLDDKLLFSLVEQKGTMVEQGRAIANEMEELAKKHEALNGKLEALTVAVNKHKLSIIERTKTLAKALLGEYEIPVTTEIRDGKVFLIVTNALTEFQDSFKEFDKWKDAVPRKKKLPAKQ